ncbi:DUF2924 domain-containing protein [Chelativorans sp. YIM 93263]|uniref:DUF2924 domain-containing protein n=1 Tax=Chelativorans sp. YIM 93263 TaxID=2906648 RepID=UPI0023786D97|nr:DUF2924 domain-containing protein [Chelativorans sp. YIM 93263]
MALKTTPTSDLKQQWGDLFESEPPAFNRRYLESRLAYRIQELAYGGLKPQTIRRLERLGEVLDGGDRKKSRIRADLKPIAGTRLIREWQGAPLRRLHEEVLRGRAGAGVQLTPRPARGMRGLHPQPALRGLGAGPRPV